MSSLSFMVALPVPEPYKAQLAAIQEQLRPPGWKITIGPHITLIAPGKATATISEAKLRFSQLAEGFPALALRYPAIGAFKRRGLSTLFLKPIADEELFEMQRRLSIVAGSWQDTSRTFRRPFVPHVTLVNRLPESEAEDTIEKLGYLTPLQINFEHLALFAKRENDREWLQIA